MVTFSYNIHPNISSRVYWQVQFRNNKYLSYRVYGLIEESAKQLLSSVNLKIHNIYK